MQTIDFARSSLTFRIDYLNEGGRNWFTQTAVLSE